MKVTTSHGRNCIFGPRVQAHSEDAVEYKAVKPKADNAIAGLYHSPVSRIVPIKDVGVSIPNNSVKSTRCSIYPTIDMPCPLLGGLQSWIGVG
jgi:hypothetical protein